MGRVQRWGETVQEIRQRMQLLGSDLARCHEGRGGDRAQEYADRLNGTPYEEIAKRGGGILFTMKETQNAGSEKLFEEGRERIQRLYSYGVGTIEIKSGYGLSYEKENAVRQKRAVRRRILCMVTPELTGLMTI